MAFEEIKDVGMEGDRGLVAGRSQREKRRSYKDLLREEEEIAAEVRKSSKKRPKDSELFLLGGGDSHKKKKKHSDDYYYRDHDGSGPPPHKKKRKSTDRSPPLSAPSAGSSHPTDTAMGLLQAITSPMATGSDPSPHLHKKPSYPTFSSHSSKDRKREGSGNKGSHSLSHSRPVPSSSSSSSKKHSSSKSSLFHGGAQKEEPLTLREADGLKMKLIMSPEKEEAESYPSFSASHTSKGGARKEKDRERGAPPSKSPKKKVQQSRDPLPVVGKEVEVEGHYGGGMGDDSSSSGGELEAGELVIDDSYTHLSKKKKKSKKSKKKKDKEKSGKEKKHSKGSGGSHPDAPRGHGHSQEYIPHSHVGPMYAMGGHKSAPIPHHIPANDTVTEKKKKKGEKHEKDDDKPSWSNPDCSRGYNHPSYHHLEVGPMYALGTPAAQEFLQGKAPVMEKKKKKEEKKEEKHEKDKDKQPKKPKRTAPTTAYQVFCKEYRVNINTEQPGLGQGLKAGPNKQMFGELSKKLAEVWKAMPEKDKLVWRQKAQYLQHKQNKAEATTVKRKTSTDGKSKGSIKGVGITTGLVSPPRASTGVSLSPARVPDVDPIDAAAHLQLLGESLSLIGHRLQETEGMVAVSGSLSVLLDSILCALGPLTCLTAQIPQLNGCPRTVLSNTLDNIAYIMPGL